MVEGTFEEFDRIYMFIYLFTAALTGDEPRQCMDNITRFRAYISAQLIAAAHSCVRSHADAILMHVSE